MGVEYGRVRAIPHCRAGGRRQFEESGSRCRYTRTVCAALFRLRMARIQSMGGAHRIVLRCIEKSTFLDVFENFIRVSFLSNADRSHRARGGRRASVRGRHRQAMRGGYDRQRDRRFMSSPRWNHDTSKTSSACIGSSASSEKKSTY